ncbi:D-alanyl-lipoteichoic acid acyltransferase DltB, MBOAT superfamily [Cetobacterium ceti]|uniref:D-alanyl-lipoteichoic acid acyltransferase DltB, MBOAT superfamily n=1 Tax=Cetobacterium ceti TaxID=180163 RepID=A0A1T4LWS9_9FUSO|nr:MBOAT family O-acyltransferase [Cetobacterium ceti]SJZ59086.1 D-alanyl-lipoteichoic acid acyltransferase DltB, MBOAT superfamily [Cetobacterium ceti]
MLFNSLEFLIYFPIVVLFYFILPFKYRWIWLLVASYYFYMNWNPQYAILMGISTIVTYLSGLFIEKSNNIADILKRDKYKKLCIIFSFGINLSILFFFKYFNFLSENINYIFSKFGLERGVPRFDVLLPVGISFYTFQALSYTMDVYRGEIKAQKNLGKYALFVSFFPQLVAGPIERSTNLLNQLDKNYNYDYDRVKNGLLLMLWGFFKKIVIADRLAVVVNTVYNTPAQYKGFTLIIASIFFAFQIYCDFSSYSDIAIGAANVMGYDLMKNFDKPYFSKSIAEFWRRWHISLGTWFRDYLYFPLGGNRVTKLKKYRNIMIIFLVSGLWHGASWNFIIWGALHGIYQLIGMELKPIRDKIIKILKIKRNAFSHRLYRVTVTFILVDFAWIFFRANSFREAKYIIKNIFVYNPEIFFDGTLYRLGLDKKDFIIAIIMIIFLNIIKLLQRNTFIKKRILELRTTYRWILYYGAIFITTILGYYGDSVASQFIYFQF